MALTGPVLSSRQAGGSQPGLVRAPTGHHTGPAKVHVMAIAMYAALLPVCSFILGVVGFFVGRCSRKIPVLDDNLPRALYRGQLPPRDSCMKT